VLAIVVKLTIVEPRARLAGPRPAQESAPPVLQVLSNLWRQRSLRHLSIAIVFLFTMGAGLGPWYASFMIRSHGMGTAELGVWLGLIFGITGVIGILAGGYISGRLFGNDPAAHMRLTALLTGLMVPFFVLFLLLPDAHWALGALMALLLVGNFMVGPIFALLQRLVGERMQATTLAVVMLLSNLIGMGIGPQVVGILSDVLAPVFGSQSLRFAMLAVSFLSLCASYHFLRVAVTVREDLRAVEQRAPSIPYPISRVEPNI
jgi:predicted MFS family arabinose efflux permease